MQAEKAVEHLNSLLRGEISAVETYRKAMAKVKTPTVRTELAECERSHEIRIGKLRDRVLELGGKPAETSGVWGTLSKLIEGGATALGERPAIMALEEGEDHGVANYRRAMHHLHAIDEESCGLVEQELLPAQMRTHRAMSSLRATLH